MIDEPTPKHRSNHEQDDGDSDNDDDRSGLQLLLEKMRVLFLSFVKFIAKSLSRKIVPMCISIAACEYLIHHAFTCSEYTHVCRQRHTDSDSTKFQEVHV